MHPKSELATNLTASSDYDPAVLTVADLLESQTPAVEVRHSGSLFDFTPEVVAVRVERARILKVHQDALSAVARTPLGSAAHHSAVIDAAAAANALGWTCPRAAPRAIEMPADLEMTYYTQYSCGLCGHNGRDGVGDPPSTCQLCGARVSHSTWD
jgi:DNA-directed RNA polymerase subunit RPC12/RpoP